MEIPEKLLYTNDHEWVKADGDFAYIGITDYAQSELGDIVFVELPQVEDEFLKGDVFGTIEAVKTVADLFSPVSGKVVEVNSELEDCPEFINDTPYTSGWLIKIMIKNKSELSQLIDCSSYKKIT